MVRTVQITTEIPQSPEDKVIDVPVFAGGASSTGAVVEETVVLHCCTLRGTRCVQLIVAVLL